MLEPWRTGIITKIVQAAPAIRSFFIAVPELLVFNFKPGQFVTLDLPIHEQRNKRWRSYSVASAPTNSNQFELVIVLLEGGLGTTYLFNEVTIGSQLLLRGPAGVFTMPADLDKDLYLICTGTGIAPFRSMLQYIHHHKIPHQNIYLIFGCRTLQDTLYEEEMLALQANEPGFYYCPTFSREEVVPCGYYQGYVHGVYENLVNNNEASANFYLCGWKNMIDEARERLTNLGYEKKYIHYELYG